MSTSKELLIEHTVPGGEAPKESFGTKRANSKSLVISAVDKEELSVQLRRERVRRYMRKYRAAKAILAKQGRIEAEKPREEKKVAEIDLQAVLQASALEW